MSLLSQIAAAIRAAFAGIRTITRRCRETGRLIFETVRDASAAAPAVAHSVPDTAEPAPAARWNAIRELAIAMLNDADGPAHYAAAGERDTAWLAVLSRNSLARIACASDRAIEAHVTGEQPMRGICAADPESVSAMLHAIALDELKEAEAVMASTVPLLAAAHGPRMAYA